IAHYPDAIIDIVTDSPSRALPSPSVESSAHRAQIATGESSHPTQMHSSDSMDLSVSRLSVQPTPTSPPTYSSSSSSGLVTYQAASLACPMSVLESIASDIAYLRCQLDQPSDQPSAHHQQLLERLIHMSEQQSKLVDQQNEMLMQAASKEREKKMLRMQQETIDRLIVNQQRVDAILDQNHQLRECSVPQLFVILPEPTSKWDRMPLLVKRYRLHFLCECGEHLKADSGQSVSSSQTMSSAAISIKNIPVKNRVHLTNHAGYELSRPNEFYDRYGTFVLGTLKILKHCMEVASAVVPVAGLAQGDMRQSIERVDTTSKNTMDAVNISIGFLNTRLNDSNKLAEDYGWDGGLVGGQEDNDMLQGLAALEGADLLRLDTFLRSNDQDKVLGDLYRINTETGHVKWVCFDHYKETHRPTALESFAQFVEKAGSLYDTHIRKVVITLISTSSAIDFFGRLAKQASAVEELDVSLDWKFDSSDLDMLVDLVGQSNVRTLSLDLKNVNPNITFVGTLFGRGKYHSLLGLLSNIKIRGLCFSNFHSLGKATSNLPSGQSPSLLQSFHFLACISSWDNRRLINIIQHCPGLVDLRLGSPIYSNYSYVDLPFYNAICTLKKLKVLHLYYFTSWILHEEGYTFHVLEAMRDVVFVGFIHKSILQNVLQGSMATLEVLS
ncbi:hypothetical protein BGX29_004005, partial [Mortierella sp. GBA35]